MEKHPSYQAISPFLSKYPKAAASIFQAYNDIVYAQQWKNIEIIDLQSCGRVAIRGRKTETDDNLHVVPCSLTEVLSYALLQDAFKPLGGATEIYLGICSDDASIVYYKLSQGIVKPPI